jgi:hypothetical protein
MKLALFVLVVLLGALSLVVPGSVARADAPVRPVTFALIVTNNRSATLARPDLRYADDDGAKYYELFRMLAPEENTHLLTELDRDTERLFPDLAGKTFPPTRDHVLAAARAIAVSAREALAAGHAVELYFVFAGHGDVDRGQGFLELVDSQFTSEDLEALLKSIPYTHAHVILDSCNSFFVLNARKPGGQRFATSEEATRSIAARLPNVGVFLSTSSASAVFEWSELEAGIFSHAVRSGLMGGADANGDGVVSYAELRAFVGLASSALKNPIHRPQVYARGPSGSDGDAMIDLRAEDGAVLRVDASRGARLTVRDRDDVPWIDLNKEDRFAVTLRMPRRAAEGAIVEESGASPGVAGRDPPRFAYPTGDGVLTASLEELSPINGAPPQARGPSNLSGVLFAVPFGPRALAAFEQGERERGPEVFGVSADDRARMQNMLEVVADVDRGTRVVGGGSLLALGAAFGVAGGYSFANANGTPTPGATRASGGADLALGGAAVLGGGLLLILPSSGEKLRDDFLEGLRRHPEDPSLVVADTEGRLRRMAESEHTERLWLRWTSAALTGVGVLGLVVTQTSPWLGQNGQAEHNAAFASDALAAGIGACLFVRSLFPTPIEHMWKLWSEDPGLRRTGMQPSVQMSIGLGSIGLSGTF